MPCVGLWRSPLCVGLLRSMGDLRSRSAEGLLRKDDRGVGDEALERMVEFAGVAGREALVGEAGLGEGVLRELLGVETARGAQLMPDFWLPEPAPSPYCTRIA